MSVRVDGCGGSWVSGGEGARELTRPLAASVMDGGSQGAACLSAITNFSDRLPSLLPE